jgi:S1-C subfamily serine protease
MRLVGRVGMLGLLCIAWGVYLPAARAEDAATTPSGFLGLQIMALNADQARALGVASGNVMVLDVLPAGPGHLAGIAVGDIITHVNAAPLNGLAQMVARVGALAPQEHIQLTIKRQETIQTVAVLAGAWPKGWQNVQVAKAVAPQAHALFANLTPALRQKYKVRWGVVGAVVTRILKADFKNPVGQLNVGDVVLAVNGVPVVTANDVVAAFDQIAPADPYTLTVWTAHKGRQILWRNGMPARPIMDIFGGRVANLARENISDKAAPQGDSAADGVVVIDVPAYSPLAATGIRVHDHILAINERAVKDVWHDLQRGRLLQDRYVLKYRDHETGDIYSAALRLPTQARAQFSAARTIGDWGLEAVELPYGTLGAGVRLQAVAANGVAWRLGLRQGDTLLQVNGRRLETLGTMQDMFQRAKTTPHYVLVASNRRIMLRPLRWLAIEPAQATPRSLAPKPVAIPKEMQRFGFSQ